MPLTASQIAAIKKQVPKNIATRNALLSKKVSNVQAGAAAEKMREGVSRRQRSIDASYRGAMSPSAKATDAAQQKKNADLEKHRRFAKGEKKMAVKDRVGTRKEYKALGEEIKTRAELHKKAAAIAKKKIEAAKAAKAAEPVNARPTPKVETAAKAETPKSVSKPTTTAPKVRPGAGVGAQGGLNTAAEVDKYKAAVASGKSKGEAVRIAKAETKAVTKVAETVAKSTAKKAATKGILGAAGRVAGKAIGGRVGVALTAASLVGGPILKQLSKDTKGRTTGDMLNARAAAAVAGGKSSSKPATTATRVKDYAGPGVNAAPKATGGKYRVSSGDTLSGIAQRAGVTLAELRKANPQLETKGIFRNTGVNIPKSGKMPTGGYTGPVPYKAPKKK